MRNKLKLAAVLIAVIALFGCATPPKVALQPSTKQSIKRIAIIETPEPEQYMMNPGQMPAGFMLYAFGALGGAILGGIEGNRIDTASKTFTAAVAPYKPDVSAAFRRQLEDGLKTKGYEVTIVPSPPKLADGKTYDVTKVEGQFDAYLIGSIMGGYSVDDGHTAPRLGASVSLVSRTGTSPLFAQSYLYGLRNFQDSIQIVPDTKFSMSSPETACQNGPLAAEAMRTGAMQMAKLVLAEF